MAKKKSQGKTNAKGKKPVGKVKPAPPKPMAKPKAAKGKVSKAKAAKAAVTASRLKKKAARPKSAKVKIVVAPTDHVPGAAFQAPKKIDRLPTIIPHDEDKGLGEAPGYAHPAETKPSERLTINIVPDEEDQAKGISPGYESGQAPRVAKRRDNPTVHTGSGTMIPDEDDNLGQHEF